MRRKCEACGKPFEAKRPNAKFCGDTCRQRAARARKSGRPLAPVVPLEREPVGPVEGERPLVAATRARLEAADLVDTIEGQQALLLAERLSTPFETGSAVSTLSKELSRVIAEAFRGKGAGDVVDEIRARRDAKRAGAG